MNMQDVSQVDTTAKTAADSSGENDLPCKTVVTCYSAVDRFFPACGLLDLTEGMYHGNPEIPYEQAQTNQIDFLLDQIKCKPGRRILDLGCGYGTVLERIRLRGSMGVGVTISPEQMKYCQKKKLDVYLLDYRTIPEKWERTFDGVIANGSIEHFVQPADVFEEKQDEIYRRLFAKVHRLINPNSSERLFATTTIHFIRKPSIAKDITRLPFAFRWGSDNFHWAVLERGWGGYYPEIGQLQRCAEGYFDLIEEVDGTEDYRLTSEEWVQRVRRALLSVRAVKIALRSLPVLVRCPGQFLILLLSLLLSDSWNWQFHPTNTPTRLLRQIWAYQNRI